MLFISYYELSPDIDPTEMADVAETFLTKNLYPVEGVEQISWYISATDNWGITITKSESAEAMARATHMWSVVKPGIFKVMKTTPAMETDNIITSMMKLREDFRK